MYFSNPTDVYRTMREVMDPSMFEKEPKDALKAKVLFAVFSLSENIATFIRADVGTVKHIASV